MNKTPWQGNRINFVGGLGVGSDRSERDQVGMKERTGKRQLELGSIGARCGNLT